MGLFGTSASILSDLALVTVMVSAITALIGQRRIIAKRYWLHHLTMLVAVSLLGLFFVFYLSNYFIYGVTPFGGSETEGLIYFPFLIAHIAGAIIMAVICLYLVVKGLRRTDRSQERERSRFKFEPKFRNRHRRLGKWGFRLWYLTALSGLGVYVQLYILFV
ncbi:MAG: DUF420 domain-containing protein [Candidatus Heimdallarchaeota archaeon]